MRVLYIASGDSKYGAPRSLVELIFSMKKNHGIDPVLLTRGRNRINELCDELGIENYTFWNRDIMAGSAYSNRLLNELKHMVKWGLFLYGGITQSGVEKIGLDFSSIDLIHSNLNRNDIGAYIAKKHQIPHIWHLREFGEKDYMRYYKRNCISYMSKNADAFIAISKCVKQVWAESGIPGDKIQIAYNGIDISKFIEKKKRSDDKIKIIMTGRIQLMKGQDQLIRAVGLMDEAFRSRIQVDFYGEAYPDYQKQLNQLITKYGLGDSVRFCGYCDNIPEKLAEYDIGVICTKAEGFGRVTVEYMAADLAVIASDTGANPELIENGVSGMLYQYNNPEDLAEKIRFLIENPNEKNEIAAKGKQRVKEHYTTEKNAEEIYRIYEKVKKISD